MAGKKIAKGTKWRDGGRDDSPIPPAETYANAGKQNKYRFATPRTDLTKPQRASGSPTMFTPGGGYYMKRKTSANPNPSIKGTVAYEQGPKGPTGGAGTDTMWASVPGVGTKRTTSVRVQTPAGGGRTALKGAGLKKSQRWGNQGFVIGPARQTEQKQALPPKERIYGRKSMDTRWGPKPEVRQAMKGATASLKKDITSAFVPSIGVKRGKQSDLQAPAKNAYPAPKTKKR